MADSNPVQLRLDLTARSDRGPNTRRGDADGGSRPPRDEGRLADQLADRIYERLAARLHGDALPSSGELLDAAEVARILGCDRGWVYEHKAELGAVTLGAGPRPRLRFPRTAVEAITRPATRSGAAGPAGPRRGSVRRARSTRLELLEVRGRAP